MSRGFRRSRDVEAEAKAGLAERIREVLDVPIPVDPLALHCGFHHLTPVANRPAGCVPCVRDLRAALAHYVEQASALQAKLALVAQVLPVPATEPEKEPEPEPEPEKDDDRAGG